MFILCTYCDQERWVSAFEPLLYPTGFCFYRPFSYVGRYFVPQQLGEQLADKSQATSLLSQTSWNEGFFGLRFKDPSAPEFLPRFVPLRRVSLTAVEAEESVSLYFRLGGFVIPELHNGHRTLPSLDISAVVGDVAATKLFIHLRQEERTIATSWKISDGFPNNFWEAVEGALSAPAAQKSKGTVLLRLSRVSKRSESLPLDIKEIDKARHLSGCRVQEAGVYDLHLNYYRIMRSGEDYSGHAQVFCLTNTREEVQASRRAIPIIGNYRAEDLWVSPLEATQGPIQIAIEPCDTPEYPPVTVDQALAKMIGLKIPILVESRQWPRSRIVDLIWSCGSFAAAVILYHYYTRALDALQKVLLIGITTCLSVAVTTLKDVLTKKKGTLR